MGVARVGLRRRLALGAERGAAIPVSDLAARVRKLERLSNRRMTRSAILPLPSPMSSQIGVFHIIRRKVLDGSCSLLRRRLRLLEMDPRQRSGPRADLAGRAAATRSTVLGATSRADLSKTAERASARRSAAAAPCQPSDRKPPDRK